MPKRSERNESFYDKNRDSNKGRFIESIGPDGDIWHAVLAGRRLGCGCAAWETDQGAQGRGY